MSYMQSMHDFLNVVDLNAKSGVACAHDALPHPMLLTRHGSHVGMKRLSVPMLLRSCSLSCSCDCHITLSCLVRESRGCKAALGGVRGTSSRRTMLRQHADTVTNLPHLLIFFLYREKGDARADVF